ncbi:MAG: hypothetical protein K2H47_05345 [Muribaculaceae bacterium]|nr:hypothetical protein [Muribaculaceae bacterium]
MKKKFILLGCCIIAALGCSAGGYIITSCGVSVPTVGPETFTPDDWEAYLNEVNQHYCPGSTGVAIYLKSQEPICPNIP